MIAGADNKLPYGNLPRLILAWICTEVVKTRSREVVLGKSLADFMRSLDVYSSSGGKYTRLRNQMKRLFGCSVSMTYKDEHGEVAVNSLIAGPNRVLVERTQSPTSRRCGRARSIWARRSSTRSSATPYRST